MLLGRCVASFGDGDGVRGGLVDLRWYFQIFTPILHWIEGRQGPVPKPVNYPYGSRGPKELDGFIQKYGYKRSGDA